MQNHEFVKVEQNIRLSIRDWGNGKPVVFIPGWPLSHEMFEYQFNQLPQKGFRCVGITMRGFGKSSKPWGVYDYDVFAHDIEKVLDALDLHEVTLVGHSMGGAIALHYTAGKRGGRVSKLVLVGAAVPSFVKREGFPSGVEAAEVDALIKSCIADRAQLNEDFGKIFFLKPEAVSRRLGDWFFDMGMEASPHATTDCLIALRDSDLRGELSRIKVPTAIFHATQDKICPFALAEATAAGIAGSQLIKFEKSGHGLFFEEREKFNAELAKFIE